MQEMWIQFLDWEDPLEKEVATPPSILAWEILWRVEPDGLQSMESQNGVQSCQNLEEGVQQSRDRGCRDREMRQILWFSTK